MSDSESAKNSNNTTEEELRGLRQQRGVIKGQNTRFNTFLNSLDVDNLTQNDKHQIHLRKNKCSVGYDQFQNIQSRIELLTDSVDEKERVEFETYYFTTITLAESYLDNIKRQTETNGHQAGLNNQINADTGAFNSQDKDIKLPTLNLPTFDGSYENWLLFCDTFEAIINQNQKLSNVRKFQYLQASLQGDALNVIRSLEISNDTYEIAWKLLKKRYHNKKLMISTHIKAIFSIPDVTKESYVSLRSLCDSLQKHLRALEMLKQPVQSWDLIVLHILSNKLDYSTNKEWETLLSKKGESEMPSVNEFIDFLHQRCMLLEAIYKNKTDKSKQLDLPKTQYTKRNFGNSSAFIATTEICELCKDNHQIYVCKKFLNMPIEKRIDYVSKSKRCYNCLKPNHIVQNCRGGNCKICNKKHASLLHSDNFKSHSNKTSQNSNTHSETTNQPRQEEKDHSVSYHSLEKTRSQILLSTALVDIENISGKKSNSEPYWIQHHSQAL